MASSDATQRAVLAGLSCGIGLAAPVVMYAATLPFSSMNETVVAGAVPFAVGAVAGVGIYAASLSISEYRAQREERLFQPNAMGGAANLNQHQSEFKTASIPAQQQDATPYAAASASQAQAEQPTSAFLSGLTGAFQRRHADDGVPTIARAADAMDEDEAWSMIDSMLDDDSPVSCDPRATSIKSPSTSSPTAGRPAPSIATTSPPRHAPCLAPRPPLRAARRLSWHSSPTRQPITLTALPRRTRTLLPTIRTLMKP